jgi:hypothetical protein
MHIAHIYCGQHVSILRSVLKTHPRSKLELEIELVFFGRYRSVFFRYLPYRYRRKSRSVHFGIIFWREHFLPSKWGPGPLFEEKGGTGPLFDTASPPFAEKRSSRQISNTDWNTDCPVKSDTGKIPIPKKLLVTPWYLFIGEFSILKITTTTHNDIYGV